MALGICAMLASPSLAQRPHGAQNRPPDRPPKQEKQQQRQDHRQQQQDARRAQAERRQPENPRGSQQPNPNRPDGNARANNNPNRPPSAYTPPPPRRTFNELTPPEKNRVIENYKKLQSLPPSQRQEITGPRKDTWGTLTPEQKNHIKTDVYPKWKQLPPERRKAISQRLGVLQNMPESARNQHLNDPNFTRGMSEEDKSTLRDLSHMHVGAPPEPPPE